MERHNTMMDYAHDITSMRIVRHSHRIIKIALLAGLLAVDVLMTIAMHR